MIAPMAEVTIYHNPACGTSRNTLALLRHAGIAPEVVEYLKTPPDREKLRELLGAMRMPVRALLREKEATFAELGLADPKWTDEQLLDFIVAHPLLMNRPIVVTPLGTKLCRPAEEVLEILPMKGPIASFTKSASVLTLSEAGTPIAMRELVVRAIGTRSSGWYGSFACSSGCAVKVEVGAIRKVWSSLADTKALIATIASPPGRFSTTTGLPHFAASLSASRRVVMSTPLPGPSGRIMIPPSASC